MRPEQPFDIGARVRLQGLRDSGEEPGVVTGITWDDLVQVTWADVGLEGQYHRDNLLLDKKTKGRTTMSTLPTDEPKKAIGADDRGLHYPSAAVSGHVEIELPSLPGNHSDVERLHARDFGPFVVGKIESAQSRQGYLRSGPTQTPQQVFRHYTAVARGASLLDAAGLERMSTLAKEFERADSPQEYFARTVRPFLHGLTPGKR